MKTCKNTKEYVEEIKIKICIRKYFKHFFLRVEFAL